MLAEIDPEFAAMAQVMAFRYNYTVAAEDRLPTLRDCPTAHKATVLCHRNAAWRLEPRSHAQVGQREVARFRYCRAPEMGASIRTPGRSGAKGTGKVWHDNLVGC